MDEKTAFQEMQDALNNLKTSMIKQWGVIPGEISDELAVLEDLINPPAEEIPDPLSGE